MLLGELLGAMSYALDLTEGEQSGHVLRTCLIGMGIGRARGPRRRARSATSTTRSCSRTWAARATPRGSPRCCWPTTTVAKRSSKRRDLTRATGRFRHALATAAHDRPVRERVQTLRALATSEGFHRELIRIRCERGASIADDLGFPPATVEAIRSLDEHWDGDGHPLGLRGEEIPLLGAHRRAGADRGDLRRAHRPPARPGAGSTRTWSRSCARSGSRATRPRSRPRCTALAPADAPRSRPTRRGSAASRTRSPRSSTRSRPRPAGTRTAWPRWSRARRTQLGLGGERERRPRRAAARHRQARPLQPDPRQAGPAHLEASGRPSAAHPLQTEAVLHRAAAAAADRRGSPARTTSGSTAAATRAASPRTSSPLAARLITVADVYDSMVSSRPYRVAHDAGRARSRGCATRRGAGRLDADCVDALAAFVSRPGREHGAPTVADGSAARRARGAAGAAGAGTWRRCMRGSGAGTSAEARSCPITAATASHDRGIQPHAGGALQVRERLQVAESAGCPSAVSDAQVCATAAIRARQRDEPAGQARRPAGAVPPLGDVARGARRLAPVHDRVAEVLGRDRPMTPRACAVRTTSSTSRRSAPARASCMRERVRVAARGGERVELRDRPRARDERERALRQHGDEGEEREREQPDVRVEHDGERAERGHRDAGGKAVREHPRDAAHADGPSHSVA